MSRDILLAPALTPLPGVLHAFSLSLRTPAEQAEFASAAGFAAAPLRLKQVHGATVVRAEQVDRAAPAIEGDAWVATSPGIPIAIATADCVPVLLADADARVIGAVHAGWRGLRARILPRALAAMVELGARPERIRAGIGPAVQGSCYEVGDEVRSAFDAAFPRAAELFNGRRLDLLRATRLELEAAGVPPAAVSAIESCTHCRPELASHRREGQARGTNLAVITLIGEMAVRS